MRVCLMLAVVLALGSAASAVERDRSTAILVSPIHEAQIVRADDGKDHVEYELLVVNVFSEPVTLASVTVLDPVGKELMRIEGDALAAAAQTHSRRQQRQSFPHRPPSRLTSILSCRRTPPGTCDAPDRLHPQGGPGAFF